MYECRPTADSPDDGDICPQRHVTPDLQASSWSSTKRYMKTALGILMTHPLSAPFRSSAPPGPLCFLAESMEKLSTYRESRFRADYAGASGLAHLRTGEIVSASCDEILTALRDHDGSDHGVISSNISSLLLKMQVDVARMVNLGTTVDAGVFNLETVVQRNCYTNSSVGASIKDTLSSCRPSSLLLFSDSGSSIKDTLDGA